MPLDRNGLAQLLMAGMRGNTPAMPGMQQPAPLSWMDPSWKQEGPPGFVPPPPQPQDFGALKPLVPPSLLNTPDSGGHPAMGFQRGSRLNDQMFGRGRPGGDTETEQLLQQMMKGQQQAPSAPLGIPDGESERIRPRQYGIGQLI